MVAGVEICRNLVKIVVKIEILVITNEKSKSNLRYVGSIPGNGKKFFLVFSLFYHFINSFKVLFMLYGKITLI